MRKFKEPLPNGGVPFFADDFLMLQSELLKASLHMYSSLSTEVILSGCEPTLTGENTNVRASALSSGFVMMRDKDNGFKSEIYYVPDTPFTTAVSKIWIVPGVDIAESRTLKSSSPGDVVVTKTASVITDPSLAPAPEDPQIVLDPLPSVYIKDLLFRNSKRIGEIVPIGLVPPFKSYPTEGPRGLNLFLDYNKSATEKVGLGLYSYTGFAICNGNHNTPDLRRRFLSGLDTAHSNFGAVGKIGGAEEVYLYTEYMPPHNHGIDAKPGQPGLIRKSNFGEVRTGTGAADSGNSGSEPDLYFPPAPIPDEGGGRAHENRPPFYTVLYIQRIF